MNTSPMYLVSQLPSDPKYRSAGPPGQAQATACETRTGNGGAAAPRIRSYGFLVDPDLVAGCFLPVWAGGCVGAGAGAVACGSCCWICCGIGVAVVLGRPGS